MPARDQYATPGTREFALFRETVPLLTSAPTAIAHINGRRAKKGLPTPAGQKAPDGTTKAGVGLGNDKLTLICHFAAITHPIIIGVTNVVKYIQNAYRHTKAIIKGGFLTQAYPVHNVILLPLSPTFL